jgi:hypothetical protein
MQNTLISVDALLMNNSDVLHSYHKKLKILFYHAGGRTASLQLKTYIDLFNTQCGRAFHMVDSHTAHSQLDLKKFNKTFRLAGIKY